MANGWEWTSTEFAPFPGFRPFACYPGYSAQFFDGKHYVLKGGSVRTPWACCAAVSGIGFSPTINMSTRGSAA